MHVCVALNINLNEQLLYFILDHIFSSLTLLNRGFLVSSNFKQNDLSLRKTCFLISDYLIISSMYLSGLFLSIHKGKEHGEQSAGFPAILELVVWRSVS